ncbi:putative pentatricopeptide repeat-containing protein At1g16830 [Asparagus officinalis]|uniref:putative pentatricopeptide repeat-containing protein At1g16830 n=1 Tax=Asparagus officinalis TaxID=4686 RepID=UPI00098E2A7C|nr:putative pentatricopeptide repeat-containing protein At1g16830 [Asparagus officinalis]
MIPVLRRLTFKLKSIAGIVDELEAIGSPAEAKTFLILMRVYCRGDMFIFAREVFDEMGRRGFVPNTLARNLIIDGLFKSGQFCEGMRFFRETQMPNFFTFNIVMRNLCERGDWRGVRGVLREMVRRGFQFNVGSFTSSLDCFKKVGRIKEVFQLVGFMLVSGLRPTVEIWSILIAVLCQAGNVPLGFGLFGKMIDSGCLPTIVTYTSLIKGLLKARMLSESVGVWDIMVSAACEPDLVFYNVLIDCLSKEGRYDDAIRVFSDLHQRGFRPDSYTLSSVLPILCLSGEVSLLPELISGPDSSIDLVAYNSLLGVLCKSGFPYKSLELYNDMVARGLKPDGYSYAAVLRSLCRLGCINNAVRFYHSIVAVTPDIDCFVHSAVLDGLVAEKKYHMAIKLFREALFRNYNLDVVSYTTAIRGFYKAGRFEEAWSSFKQMKLLGILPNTYTYNVMLGGLCRTRDVCRVKQLLREMEVDGIEKDNITVNTLICFWIKVYGAGSANVQHLLHNLGDNSLSESSGSDTAEILLCVGS